MTKRFDLEIYKQIRKDMPKPTKPILSVKDRIRKADMKRGRKNWKEDQHD